MNQWPPLSINLHARTAIQGNMLKTFAKHLVHMGFMLWLITTLMFVGLSLVKGNPVTLMLDNRITVEMRRDMEHRYGFDKPWAEQYFRYVTSAFQGKLGTSFLHRKPVIQVITARMGYTLLLGGLAFLIATILTSLLLMGSHLATHAKIVAGSQAIQTFCLTVPSFLIATFLMAVLGVRLKWLPIAGAHRLYYEELNLWGQLLDLGQHALMPACSMAIPITGLFCNYLGEQLRQLELAPFVLSARGRGVSERRIFFNHKLRVLRPVIVQLLGLYLPLVASGGIIVEAIFGWPGLGTVLYEAVMSRDYPLLMGGTIWTSLFVIIGYELADYCRNPANTAGEMS